MYFLKYFCYRVELFSQMCIFLSCCQLRLDLLPSPMLESWETLTELVGGEIPLGMESRLGEDMEHYGYSTDVNKYLLLLLGQSGVDLGVNCNG